jgi:DNA polymerase-3 subunit epsilon
MLKALRREADRRRQGDGEYAWLFHPYTGDELVAIDSETTGLDTRTAELVSIAAVKIRGERVLTSESLNLRLVRPGTLTAESIRIHGLRGIDLADGESLERVLVQLLDFIGNRPLVGWCLGFHLAIINRELRQQFGFDLPNAGIDVAQLHARQWRHRHPGQECDRRFVKMAEALDVPVMGRHTALGDAVTTALMYLRLERGAMSSKRAP